MVAYGGSTVPPGHILIDSAFSINLFSDPELFTNVCPADHILEVVTAGGPVYCMTVAQCVTAGI